MKNQLQFHDNKAHATRPFRSQNDSSFLLLLLFKHHSPHPISSLFSFSYHLNPLLSQLPFPPFYHFHNLSVRSCTYSSTYLPTYLSIHCDPYLPRKIIELDITQYTFPIMFSTFCLTHYPFPPPSSIPTYSFRSLERAKRIAKNILLSYNVLYPNIP